MFSIYCTFPGEKAAKDIARKLVAEKLIACANIFPITSIYGEKGKMKEQKEWAMIGKCAESKIKLVEKRLLELHPYDIPAVLWHEEQASEGYSRWVGW